MRMKDKTSKGAQKKCAPAQIAISARMTISLTRLDAIRARGRQCVHIRGIAAHSSLVSDEKTLLATVALLLHLKLVN